MSALGIGALPFDGTAQIFAVVLLTLFNLVADAFALQVIDFVDLFASHDFAALLFRVVDLEARELDLSLVADAALVDHLFAAHAIVDVALLDALMSTAGKEPLTK